MGKLVYCTDNFLEEFRVNFSNYIDLYKNKDKEALKKIFTNENNVKETNISFEYKSLVKTSESENAERDNIKIVFESLKDLKITRAIQEKFWVAMYNYYYQDHIFDYVDEYRHYKKINSKIESSILFTRGKKRSLIVQNLSRMWWLGYYLYDEDNKDNPYWLLDFYTKDSDIIGRSTMFFSSAITNNKNIRLGIVEAIKELTDDGIISFDRYHYINTAKYFNMLGSVQVLDLMSREDIKKLSKNYILEHRVNNK